MTAPHSPRATLFACIVGAAIAACFTKPDAPGEVDDGGTVVPGDGGIVVSMCNLDDFPTPGSNTCGTWGVLDAGSARISNGQLTLVAPSSGAAASARCQSEALVLTRATLDIVAAGLPSLLTTRIGFFWTIDGNRYGAEFGSGSGAGSASIRMLCASALDGSQNWIPTLQRYVRLVLTARNTLELQVSSNGADWSNVVGSCIVPVSPAQVGVEVLRLGSGGETPASFESLELCR